MSKGKTFRPFGCLLAVILLAFYFVYSDREKKSRVNAQRSPLRNLVYEMALPSGTQLKDGIAIAVLIETSNAMAEMTEDLDQQPRSKLLIAKLAVEDLFWEFRNSADRNPEKQIRAALYAFHDTVQTLVRPGPPDLVEVKSRLSELKTGGESAMGDAMVQARLDLNATGLKKQHIIILTNGENTAGRRLFLVLRAFWELPQGQHPEIYMAGFGFRSANFQEFQRRGVLFAIDVRNKNHLKNLQEHILLDKSFLENPVIVPQPPSDRQF